MVTNTQAQQRVAFPLANEDPIIELKVDPDDDGTGGSAQKQVESATDTSPVTTPLPERKTTHRVPTPPPNMIGDAKFKNGKWVPVKEKRSWNPLGIMRRKKRYVPLENTGLSYETIRKINKRLDSETVKNIMASCIHPEISLLTDNGVMSVGKYQGYYRKTKKEFEDAKARGEPLPKVKKMDIDTVDATAKPKTDEPLGVSKPKLYGWFLKAQKIMGVHPLQQKLQSQLRHEHDFFQTYSDYGNIYLVDQHGLWVQIENCWYPMDPGDGDLGMSDKYMGVDGFWRPLHHREGLISEVADKPWDLEKRTRVVVRRSLKTPGAFASAVSTSEELQRQLNALETQKAGLLASIARASAAAPAA